MAGPGVKALVRAMIRGRCEIPDQFEIAPQLVRDHDTGFTRPVGQPCEETCRSFGVALWLNETIKHVTVRVYRPPEPVFSAVDRDDDLIQMPFVDRGRSVAPDTIGKMAAKTVHPFPDWFPSDHPPRSARTPSTGAVLSAKR
ncbi:hypothetical protein GCM10011363_27360 [Marivita lacus]|uniref:Uncharacterized protein n=1 Tax=Marivita lacus TaxID=1323742 RepID=A0ABQ1KT61_9RHOB|nr:hypothetical protein GCM10011363_27360 [Marivita lacus]